MNTCKDVDTYISTFPKDTQKLLQDLRKFIRSLAPEAEETFSYAMPTFKLGKNLVHFAAYDKHIGFYPTPSGIKAFEKELNEYTYAKGSVQFPIDKPLPFDLIKRIVEFRVKENLSKAK